MQPNNTATRARAAHRATEDTLFILGTLPLDVSTVTPQHNILRRRKVSKSETSSRMLFASRSCHWTRCVVKWSRLEQSEAYEHPTCFQQPTWPSPRRAPPHEGLSLLGRALTLDRIRPQICIKPPQVGGFFCGNYQFKPRECSYIA